MFATILERAIAADGDSLCLLHGDYNTRQVVLNADGTAVAAVVDYEYACLGPALLDLIRTAMSGVRGRDASYDGYDLTALRRRPVQLFTVLDRLQEVVASRALEPSLHRSALIDLHRALDAARF